VNWDDLSESARAALKDLGNFGPTVTASHRLVKGYMANDDGDTVSVYYTSRDMREMAKAFVEVAEWLDKRAEEHTNEARGG
jgi:hypothetical protein